MKTKNVSVCLVMFGLYVNYVFEKPYEVIVTDDIHNESSVNVEATPIMYFVSGSQY
jgi:hypothetical protein